MDYYLEEFSPCLVDESVMVFDASSEVQPGIDEDCDSGVVFCDELDEFWQN